MQKVGGSNPNSYSLTYFESTGTGTDDTSTSFYGTGTGTDGTDTHFWKAACSLQALAISYFRSKTKMTAAVSYTHLTLPTKA